MYRTHTCGELRTGDIGKQVSLAGWVQYFRQKGAVSWIVLRDRYGYTQVVFEEGRSKPELLEALKKIGREDVLQIQGEVIERYSKNKELPTGDIEILADSMVVLNHSATPPFTIEEESDGGDDLRMKYRYLDLRRPPLRRNLELRYRVSRAAREYLDAQGFFEIETPFLIRSTPEGARDFVVPSRMNPGQFYALPQSPQTFKQLLMVSGYDRYFQVVKCFRDEDLRADRQPEFTQIDCEMAFVEQEDVLRIFEGLFKDIFKKIRGLELKEDFPRISWEEAMRHYGNDKPDIRFGMKLCNLKVEGHYEAPILSSLAFKVLEEAPSILAIRVEGGASWTRKQLDELTDWVKRPQIGMSGLLHLRHNPDGSFKSSADKFLTQEVCAELGNHCSLQAGDLLLMLAGPDARTRKAASELRLHLGNMLGLRKPDEFAPLWVVDFPLLEQTDDGHWTALHHPFTAPKPEHALFLNQPEHFGKIRANAYDIVLNGTEIGGGSIRIHERGMQEAMFAALGMSREEAQEQFGFLLGAFEYGAPPHGGIAFGFDRLCALLGGQEGIRDFIAFPKNNAGRDVMLDAPAGISPEQKKELGL
ncbi:MAG: aspartate--tRNA ligase [Bacteroidetes bacterium]|nr:aspartate--tRNA ligase [Bacteroidota bacterium]